ncbi:hypothetical protein [Natrinema longum]|uniref:Uncharacterized protein n=1 Tax=Natrinema longum TaxID=370324 RepID=A0A8A2U9K2_9EURY|nr:hypothetical protein [Natrinema longum]MBZ6493767.1 hypothetical protein [Natrinema longum]QSW84895.1 hypothetical protein J0X27_15810 [Natrinema longum]
MSSHESRSQGTTGRRGRTLIADLFDIDIERVESLSWALGNHVTVEADADRRFRFAHRQSTRAVTAFEVTDTTCVLRLRTPVGREKFFGVATADLTPQPVRNGWIRTD